MKRDMDLIRRIAIATADLAPGQPLQQLPDLDAATWLFHVELMEEAGLVKATVSRYLDANDEAVVWRLTWAGSDFVDATRDDALWRKVVNKVLNTSASFTFDLLKEALKSEISKGLSSLL